MDINTISNVTQTYNKDTSSTNNATTDKSTTKSTGFSETAAVYKKTTDHSAIVAQMKADTQARMDQMTNLVRQMMQGQGNALAKSDDIWSFLASGNFSNVDEAAVAQAKEDISENGYWGVNQTSSRIVDFAIALSGDDTSKAETLINAFKKGYEEATQAWGQKLPDISSQTYDAVMDKFQQWKDGTYQSSTIS